MSDVNMEMSSAQDQHERSDMVKEEQTPVVGSSQLKGTNSATTSGENPAMGDVQ